MTTDLPYAAYGAIGAEPWLYPYNKINGYRTQLPHNGELRGALATPLVLGPGWYKGFRVYFDPSAINYYDTRKQMPSYGYIANLPGPRRGVYPVSDPVGGFRRPHGPVRAAAYIPSNLPIIRPGPGWHIGPSVFSTVPVGTVYGEATTEQFREFRAEMFRDAALSTGLTLGVGLVAYVVLPKVTPITKEQAGNILSVGTLGSAGYFLWKTYGRLREYAKQSTVAKAEGT